MSLESNLVAAEGLMGEAGYTLQEAAGIVARGEERMYYAIIANLVDPENDWRNAPLLTEEEILALDGEVIARENKVAALRYLTEEENQTGTDQVS